MKRIVSLAPSITEILFDLGLNEEIAGVTDFCDFPEAALNKPKNERMNNPLYSIKTVLSKAPEIIIISSMESKRNYLNLVKMWQNWKSISAVKRKAIYVVDSNLLDRPSPRIVEGLEAIVRMIHPEAM